jgi:iron(III) transport system substrate-binding protein
MSTYEGFAKCFSRRQLLRLVAVSGGAALAAGCSVTTPTPPAQQAPVQATAAAPTQTWEDVVAAAKKEGVLSIATYAGTGYRKVMDDFEAAFPGMKVEQTGFQSSSRDFVPRLLQERNASLSAWDIAVMPSPEMLIQVHPVGGLDPIRPLIVHPEVLPDANWGDGFNGGFVDTGKQLSYAITRARSQSLWIDMNQVRDDEIKSYRDLLDPKWNGQTARWRPAHQRLRI